MGRNFEKISVIALISTLTILLIATVTGFGGDGSAYFNEPENKTNPNNSLLAENSCFNDIDENDHDGTDINDLGCVQPIEPYVDNIVLDRTEGNIWDTDLSATLAQDGPEASSEKYMSEGVLFDGKVVRGPRPSDNTFDRQDSSGGSSVTEQWVWNARPERSDPDKNNWGYGLHNETEAQDGDFPTGTEFENGKVIYPPNPLADDGERCGDGRENNADDSDSGKLGPDGDDDNAIDTTTNTLVETTDCRADYGRIQEKYNVTESAGKNDISCDDDTASADDDPCSGGATCGCDNGGPAESCTCDGTISHDRCYETSTVTHNINGDEITKDKCTEDSGWEDVKPNNGDRETCESVGECDKSCGRYGNEYCDTDYGDDTTSYECSIGDERSWKDEGSVVDCNNYNTVDGGADSGGTANSEGRSYDWNDEAATYTEFTSYKDNDWDTGLGGQQTYTCGASDYEHTATGRAWCAYEYTVTVDADGPKGQGEGFVVIDDRGTTEITATEALNGNDEVGERVWVDTGIAGGSGTSGFQSATDEMTGDSDIMSCPGDKEVCLKYVDYYTESGGWTAANTGSGYTDAVDAESRHTFTPDDSYSVCKNINRIARQNGGVDGDMVRCDYTREDSGSPGGVERVSPLNEACGDDPDEHLIAMESEDIDRDAMEDYLAYQQECHDYHEEDDIASQNGACVYNGEVYPEGSVINTADNPLFRSKFSESEEGGSSADMEVCMDIYQEYSGSDKPQYRNNDNGGSWYDLDDKTGNYGVRIWGDSFESNEYEAYLRENPDKDAADHTGITGVTNHMTDGEGFALEDDCVDDCEDQGDGTGKQYPVWAPFVEGEMDDDYRGTQTRFDINLDNVHNRVQAGGGTGHGASNDQDTETSMSLAWYDNSRVDSEDDEWSYTPNLQYAIGNDGKAYEPGQCYGAPRTQDVDKTKDQAIYANSYARETNNVYTGGASASEKDGDWIDPDDDTLSVTSGGVTCDLTGDDWGYAVQSTSTSGVNCVGGSCYEKGNPDTSGYDGVLASLPHEVVVEKSKFAWDMDTNPGDLDQNDLQQWKDACGDDPNEYLIREHAAKEEGEYNPTLRDDTHYACADRPTDCVLDGEVYSEGQIVDVSDATTESGVQSEDQEICLDVNHDIPGGEWWDVDNQDIRGDLIGSGTVSSPEIYVREGEIESDKPEKIFWHGSSTGDPIRDEAIREARDSPYSPLGATDLGYWRGYALEDDCDPNLECDDKGTDETRGTDTDTTSDLIYSPFRESKDGQAIKADDHSTQGSWVVRMFVDGSTSHGSDTGQMTENTGTVNFDSTNWGWPTSGVNNSKIESNEDTWAVADETYDAVGPTGAVYDTGQCHGRSPPSHSEGWVEKNETIMANSFAKRENVNSDGRDEGNWVDPDTTVRSSSRGGITCDLNSTDWGFGYDTGGGSLSVHQGDARNYGYEVDDRHAVSGDINFDMDSDPLGGNQDNLQQYGNACGDDKNEFLIREQTSSYSGGEIIPDLSKENIYVCADRITDCAYNGEIYSEGQTVDISSRSPSGSVPEQGDNIEDEEICLDLNKSTPGGEWYDKDQDIIVKHRIESLQDTFDVSQGVNGYSNVYEIEGEVVDNSGGQLDINGRIINVGSDGKFSDTVQLEGGTTQRVDYEKGGSTLAQKRLVLPSTNSDLNDLKISTSLMYDGISVWNGVENFKDNDYDIDQYDPKYHGTDWRTQDDRYSRRELSYFNRTHTDVDEPSHYNPEGYATEDDCGPLLQNSGTGPCSDVGPGVQDSEWFSAGNFSIDGVSP